MPRELRLVRGQKAIQYGHDSIYIHAIILTSVRTKCWYYSILSVQNGLFGTLTSFFFCGLVSDDGSEGRVLEVPLPRLDFFGASILTFLVLDSVVVFVFVYKSLS